MAYVFQWFSALNLDYGIASFCAHFIQSVGVARGVRSHFVRKKGKINSPLPLPALWLHAVYLWAINTIYKDAVHTLVINCTMQNCILKIVVTFLL